jgi:hypothetical protein
MKKCLLSLGLLLSLGAQGQFSVELKEESLDVLEGEVKQVKIQIKKDPKVSEEKFSVSLNACYPWIKLSKLGALEYALTFSPSFVSLIDNDFYIFEINFDVTGTSGQIVEKSLMAKIINVDQLPVIETILSDEGSQFSFELEAYDPNGELSPSIEIIPSSLPGEMNLTDLQIEGDPYFPSTKMQFTWKNIPKHLMGTSQLLSFKACTKNQLCSVSTVELKLIP